MTSFELVTPPVLSRSAVLRDETIRLDTERQVKCWRSAQLVVVDEQGRTPVSWTDDGVAHLRTRPTTGDVPADNAVLLGESDDVAYWAVRGAVDLVAGDDPSEWSDLRMTGAVLDDLGAGLFTGAVAVLNWHDAAAFCGRDGSPTRPGHAGWHRVCEAGHEDYPRTDPAVICLVHDGADRVLLARQPVWPPRRYSVLAGFVEAGESLEACVAREIHEEVGVHVSDISYLGSQAWPFPRSLMVGFHAQADPTEPLIPADGEIEDAMWVTRADVRAALRAGDWSERSEQPLLLPGPVSIARSMLDSWAALD